MHGLYFLRAAAVARSAPMPVGFRNALRSYGMRSGAEVPRRGNTYGLQPRAEAPLLLQTNGRKDPPCPSEPPGSSLISEIKHEPARLSRPHSSCWEPRQKQARVGLVFEGWLCESGAQHGPPLPLVLFVAPATCREHACGWLSATDLLLGVLALFCPRQPEERNCRESRAGSHQD